MNAFPLIHRELLVASRRPATWGLRLAAGLLTTLLFLLITTTGTGANLRPSVFGGVLFGTLTAIAFMLAGLSGARSAGIPLCEENRENTLGFLLLTTLRRHELVLGKLAAAALQGTSGLLVFVPVLALALTAGGVTFHQVWMAAVTLALVLLLSNAAGLYVAAIRTSDLQVVLRTLGLVLVACLPFGWFFLGIALTGDLDARLPDNFRGGRKLPWRKLGVFCGLWLVWLSLFFLSLNLEPTTLLLFASPAYLLFLTLTAGSPLVFALQAAGIVTCLFCLLWLTSLRLATLGREDREANPFFPEPAPRTATSSPDQPTRVPFRSTLPSAPRQPRERPLALMDVSPVVWWLHPPPARRQLIWGAAITLGLAGFYPVMHGRRLEMVEPILVPILVASVVLAYVLDYLIAWQASRLFADARRSGSLELLLVTPHFRERAIRDIWLSLRTTFLKPVLVMFALRLAGTISGVLLGGSSDTVASSLGPSIFALRTLAELTSFAALAWLGVWKSWQSRQPAFAGTKAFIIGSLLPMVVSIPFVSAAYSWRPETAFWHLGSLVFFGLLAAYARTRVKRTFLAGAAPIEVRRS